MLCPGSGHATNCSCSKLRSHYGACLFRCGYTICHSQRIAFESRSLRDSHAKCHDRPFKCTFPTCTFATLGFRSQSQSEKHWTRCHQDATPNPNQPIDDPDGDEIKPLLFDLVTMGKVEEVRRLLPRIHELPRLEKLELEKLAAFTGPLAMAQLLIEIDSFGPTAWESAEIVTESIKGENMEVLDWLAPKIKPSRWIQPVHHAALDSDAKVFEFWRNISNSDVDRNYIDRNLIKAVESPMQEIRLSAIWKELASSGKLSLVDLNNALRVVVETTCSVVLAKTLLECCADVNFKRTRVRSERTPLHVATTKTTAAAAELMKFLLLSGADPNTSIEVKCGPNYSSVKIKTPSMERGAQNISKWLGMTWDELVKWAEDQRRNKSQNDTSSCSTGTVISSSADGSTVQ